MRLDPHSLRRTCNHRRWPTLGETVRKRTLDGYAPHATDWIIYANGEEIARARSRDDLARLVLAIDKP